MSNEKIQLINDTRTTSSHSNMQQQQQKEGTIDNVFGFKMGGDDDTVTTTATKTSTENPKFKSSNSIDSSSNEKSCSNNNGNGSSSGDTSSDLKRYLKNFMLFSNLEKESEKVRREQQLSKIVKALMYFENKLRKEQEVIQQQLCEKDKVINRQMHTISNMKEKLGVQQQEGDDVINLPDTSEFCPMCRKKYYYRASKTISTQTKTVNINENNKFSSTKMTTTTTTIATSPTSTTTTNNNISDDYSSIPSIEYMSSSEEQEALLNPNPFSKARRSKKYTSKKSYKNYLQSRPRHSNNNNSIEDSNNSAEVSSMNLPQQYNSDSNNNNIAAAAMMVNNNRKEIGISKSSKVVGGGAAKFSIIMNDIHGIKHHQQQQQKQESIYDDTHSTKINRMHGISLKQAATTISAANEGKEMEIAEAKNCDDEEMEVDDDDDDDADGDDDDEDEKGKSVENGNQSAINNKIEATTRRKYCDEDLDVKQKIATRDDWYISDVDETETTLGSKTPYGNVTGVSNSVLECVNQILLQQSMDEFMESHHHHNHPNNNNHNNNNNNNDKRSSFASSDSKDSQNVTPPTRSNKRVHFSTKNSMVQITPLPPRQSLSDIHDNSTYENQSTYSNEYEPIGSSRTYVDMDSKSLENYKPKLPPKPDNLIKLTKQRQHYVQEPIYVKNKNCSEYGSEPDYCSISEIQDNINSVKIVTAEIHNDANVDDDLNNDENEMADDDDDDDEDDDDNEYSEIKEVPTHANNGSGNVNNHHHHSHSHSHPHSLDNSRDNIAEESFEDVPKLPNVYSIVPLPSTPIRKETPTKIIGHDNYITKSPMKKKISSPASKFLAEMTNNVPSSKKSLKKLPPKVPQNVTVAVKDHHHQQSQQQIKIIDEKFQQEFDWYNLDDEYTKTMDVIATQIENIDEMYQFDDENLSDDKESNVKVEYNLEFEFDKLQQDEVEEEMMMEDQLQKPPSQFSPSTSSSSSEGIEIETNHDDFTTVIKINENSLSSLSSVESSSTTPPSTPPSAIKTTTMKTNLELAETPKLDLKKKLNYEKFLSESGMLSKSLLGRKKFYAGSFV